MCIRLWMRLRGVVCAMLTGRSGDLGQADAKAFGSPREAALRNCTASHYLEGSACGTGNMNSLERLNFGVLKMAGLEIAVEQERLVS